jgi:hypothetical protein
VPGTPRCDDAEVTATEALLLRSEAARGAAVRLSFPRPADANGDRLLLVEVEADGLTVRRSVLSGEDDALDRFMHELSGAASAGWEGLRSWDSADRRLGIEARHGGDRAELTFTLRRGAGETLCVPIMIGSAELRLRLAEWIDSPGREP